MGTLTVDNLNVNSNIIGGKINAPMFLANLNSDQTVTNNARTKIQCATVVFDTAGNYDNSTNFRFTPTTAGKYYVFGQVEIYATGQSNLQWLLTEVWKNGTSSSSTTNATTATTTTAGIRCGALWSPDLNIRRCLFQVLHSWPDNTQTASFGL